jgi:CheY-like chemotaxis protein
MAAYSILVVDDEPELRELVVLVLKSAGHNAVGAADGLEAAEAIAKQHFDVVITDLIMPERDGLEFIAEVRAKYPDVKIVAMSGGGHIARDSYLRIALGFGAHAILEKPFENREILSAIETALARRD